MSAHQSLDALLSAFCCSKNIIHRDSSRLRERIVFDRLQLAAFYLIQQQVKFHFQIKKNVMESTLNSNQFSIFIKFNEELHIHR